MRLQLQLLDCCGGWDCSCYFQFCGRSSISFISFSYAIALLSWCSIKQALHQNALGTAYRVEQLHVEESPWGGKFPAGAQLCKESELCAGDRSVRDQLGAFSHGQPSVRTGVRIVFVQLCRYHTALAGEQLGLFHQRFYALKERANFIRCSFQKTSASRFLISA